MRYMHRGQSRHISYSWFIKIYFEIETDGSSNAKKKLDIARIFSWTKTERKKAALKNL